MPMSPYMRNLRARVGTDLILIPAVAAVIWDERGRVLVVDQTDGGVSLPAGAIDPGESPREAVIREVREETGLTVEVVRLLDVVGGKDFRFRYDNGDLVECTGVVFACEIVGGELHCDGSETLSARWVEASQLPALLALPYPAELFEL